MRQNMTRQAKWARKNYRRLRPQRLEWEGLHQELLMWHRAKASAKRKGIPFTIEVGDIIIPKKCPVLGIPLKFRPENRDFSPSLDRRDSLLGYVPGNIFVISNRANRIKSDATVVELTRLLRYTKRNLTLRTKV